MNTPTPLITTQVPVSGMTCGHCISSVTEELESVAGVEKVEVDLNAGGISTVTISSRHELSPEDIGEAIAEAGYVVVAERA
ncbi:MULTISPECIES: heavy-metal-associated domain-containing protein [Arthrobacter]|uniref:Heavy-metal-associated domain-containing protein n=2 Tax=Arthrobacter TaxID=1663 RepID=A0ABU9KLE4_9MICC|nr:heavy-metal-associated domain-containing protein [Arthrobacter sp. YJM1]MDP5226826.1 heavy-metal-associated domain-containing protein [Arthrobacter sp. YJM1]